MSIELITFRIPLQVNEGSEPDFLAASFFSTTDQIPADFQKDITPTGYQNRFRLHTRSIFLGEDDDTVADVELVTTPGQVISLAQGFIVMMSEMTELTEPQEYCRIDQGHPVAMIARPSTQPNTKGIVIDKIIRYISSHRG